MAQAGKKIKYDKWTEEENQFIIDNHGKMSIKEIAEKIGRTPAAVNMRMWRFGLVKAGIWDDEKDEYLRQNIGKISFAKMTKELKMAPATISRRAELLGVRKRVRKSTVRENYLNNYKANKEYGISKRAVFFAYLMHTAAQAREVNEKNIGTMMEFAKEVDIDSARIWGWDDVQDTKRRDKNDVKKMSGMS